MTDHEACEDCHVTHDCSDCGIYHTPSSAHEADRLDMEERWPEVMLVTTRIEDVLQGVDPWVRNVALTRCEMSAPFEDAR